ncbi:MAG: Ig-like domain-containing protein [Candidatus Ornithomonoglobus sp.]
MKLLNFVLAASIAASAITVPVCAGAADAAENLTSVTLISDDFENYAEGATDIGSWSNVGNANAVIAADPEDPDSKAAKLYAESGTVRLEYDLDKEYTDGVFNISYRIQSTRNIDGTNEFVTLFAKDTKNNYEYFLPNFMTAYAKIGDMSNTNPVFRPLLNDAGSQDLKLEGGQWFTVNATIDLNNHIATATVTDLEGTEFTATNEYNSGLDAIQFISGWNKPTVYVDDVTVTYTGAQMSADPTEPPENTVPGDAGDDNQTSVTLISDDFESYAEGSADIGSWSNVGNANAVIAADPEDPDSKAAKLYAESGTVRLEYDLDKEYTDGVFNISYRIQSTRNIDGTNEFVTLFAKDTKNNYEYFLPNFMTAYAKIGDMSNTNPAFRPLLNDVGSQDLKLDGGQWFTVNATIDLDSSIATATVTDSNGTAFTATNEYNSGLDAIQFICGWNKPTVYVDDVTVTYTGAHAPTASTAPTAPAASTEPVAPIDFFDDFEGYESADAVTNGTNYTIRTDGNNHTKLEFVTNGTGKALHLGLTETPNARLFWNAESESEVTSGTVGIEFDAKLDSVTGSRVVLFLNDSVKSEYTNLDFNAGILKYSSDGSSSTNLLTYEAGVWYHVKEVLDLDQNKMYIQITDTNGTELAYVQTGYTYNFKYIQFYNWSSETTGITLDNFAVKEGVSVPEVPTPATPTIDPDAPTPTPIDFFDDFEGYESADAVTNGTKYTISTDGNNHTKLELVENGGGKALHLGLTETPNARLFWNAGSESEVTSGTVGIEFDVKLDSVTGSRLVLFLNDSVKSEYTNLDFNAGTLKYSSDGSSSTNLFTYEAGVWYHVKELLDLDQNKMYIKITDTDSTELAYVQTGYTYNFKYIQFYNWSSETTGITLDNFAVKEGVSVSDIIPPENPLSAAPAVTPTEGTEIIAKADFNDISDISQSPFAVTDENGNPTDAELVQTASGDKALRLKSGADSSVCRVGLLDNLDEYSTGTMTISYAVRTDFSSEDIFDGIMTIPGTTYEAGSEASVPRILSSGVVQWFPATAASGSWWHAFASVKDQNWYVIKTVISFDKKTCEVQVYDGAGALLGSYSNAYIFTDGSGGLEKFYLKLTDAGHDGNTIVDNILIEYSEEQEAAELELPFTDDFESYSTLSDMTAKNWSMYSPSGNTQPSEIITTDKGKSFSLGFSAGCSSSTSVTHTFNTPITAGKIKVDFDIMPSASIGTHVKFDITGSDTYFPLFYFDGAGTVGTLYNYTNSSTKIGSYTAGEWYHCTAVVDLESETIEASIADSTGYKQTKSFDWPGMIGLTVDSIKAFALQEWIASADTASIFDNVVIDYVIEIPTLTESGMSFTTGSEQTSMKTNVPTIADSINLSFGTLMDTSTMKGITITNSTTNETVPYVIGTSGTTINLRLKEALDANTTYKVNVPGEVANPAGSAMGEAVTLSFTTGAAQFVGSIESVTANATEITKLNQLTEGSALTAAVKLTNATADAKTGILIVSFYSGDTLVKTSYEVIEAASGAKVSQNIKTTINGLEGVDCIKVMLWNDFENIAPLTTSIAIQ